jgi:aspartyl-tRNA(Asn)/glutamyl-tRNA(Gln) amidotransferase subunit A
MTLDYLSIKEIVGAYRTRELSPVDYVEHVLARIEQRNPQLNAFFFVDAIGARREAVESESRWKVGKPKGPLDGVPFSVKDGILTKGMPSPGGILAKHDAPAGERDAPIVARLREAGAILIGKNTQPELASLAAGISGLYGVGRNPWDLSKTPGGSSSGSAAAIAADMGPLSIGGDSGGSIRIPAAYTGTVGFKPSFGRVPRAPVASSSSVHGPMTRSVSDLPIVMNVITRPDPSDVYALPYDGVDYARCFDDGLKGKRIAASDWLGFGAPTTPEVAAVFRTAVACFEKLGAEICWIDPAFAHDPYQNVSPLIAWGMRNLAIDATSGQLETLLPELQAWVEAGRTVTLDEVSAGMGEERAVVIRASEIMSGFDYLLTPTVPTTAFAAESCFPDGMPLGPHAHTMDHFPFTWPFNFSGHPAISVPCGFADGMPVGLQIVAPRFDDVGCISTAIAFEEAYGVKPPHPPLFS